MRLYMLGHPSTSLISTPVTLLHSHSSPLAFLHFPQNMAYSSQGLCDYFPPWNVPPLSSHKALCPTFFQALHRAFSVRPSWVFSESKEQEGRNFCVFVVYHFVSVCKTMLDIHWVPDKYLLNKWMNKWNKKDKNPGDGQLYQMVTGED